MEEPYMRLINAMKQQAQEDEEFLDEVTDTFEELNLHNSIYAEDLLDLAKLLCYFSVETVNDHVAELGLDKDRGLAVNIATALQALSNYWEHKDNGGEQSTDLDLALLCILREKERRVVNEL